MNNFDYTIPSELMIKNYNSRVKKLSLGKVNIIRSWKNPVGNGLQDVEFTMANRTKRTIPITRYDLSTLVPLNENGFLVVKQTDVDAAISELPNGIEALREALARASGISVNDWWYGDIEMLWIMYGIFLSPLDYTTVNAYDLPDVDDYMAQAEPYGLMPESLTLITANPSSLGFTGQLKLVVISEYPPHQKPVRNLNNITNGRDGTGWSIAHPLAADGMEPIADEIVAEIIAIDAYNNNSSSIRSLDELTLTHSFVDNEDGGVITITPADANSTGSIIVTVNPTNEYTIKLSELTNVDTPGLVELEQPDYQIYDDVDENTLRCKYLFMKWVRDTYPEHSGANYFVEAISAERTSANTIEVTFRPATQSTYGSILAVFTYNNALKLSEVTNCDKPGIWEITDPTAVTNSYSYMSAEDELAQYIANQLSRRESISTINASVFKVTPQPDSNTPEGTSSMLLTLSEKVNAALTFLMEGELLVTYPDVNYVPKKLVDLSLVSNINEPGVWEVEATSFEDFQQKINAEVETIISIAFKNANYTPAEHELVFYQRYNGYVLSGGWNNALIAGEVNIYPYIK